MDYRLDLLSEDDFERLVNSLCREVLGTGVVSFSKGRDGGKDGRFEGTANNFPSKSSLWKGKFVIQAKHTTAIEASCSENAFHGNQTSTINEEIKKIKTLIDANEIDNYILFTNRKLTGGTEQSIRNHIRQETSLLNISIIGIETITEYLKSHKEILKQFRLDKFILPLDFYDRDIKDLIVVLTGSIKKITNPTIPTGESILFAEKAEKNKINNLDKYYYEIIRRNSLEYFAQIDDFLGDPINIQYALAYENFAAELGNKVEIRRDDFNNFKEVFGFLYDKIFNDNESELSKHRALIWVVLHHLYYNCHIGRKQ
ncbi:ABC-three component system protein [Hymenobacter sp. PAMC 26628]|uniref:ABC-three component system protein n=1 Tax=Hymenobacter sp. PAMC 26628 TaxID=1484118 RepID=UPI00090204AC|nr:ABC-three component system protein [Hymenobacter sp. PAMC 26628]